MSDNESFDVQRILKQHDGEMPPVDSDGSDSDGESVGYRDEEEDEEEDELEYDEQDAVHTDDDDVSGAAPAHRTDSAMFASPDPKKTQSPPPEPAAEKPEATGPRLRGTGWPGTADSDREIMAAQKASESRGVFAAGTDAVIPLLELLGSREFPFGSDVRRLSLEAATKIPGLARADLKVTTFKDMRVRIIRAPLFYIDDKGVDNVVLVELNPKKKYAAFEELGRQLRGEFATLRIDRDKDGAWVKATEVDPVQEYIWLKAHEGPECGFARKRARSTEKLAELYSVCTKANVDSSKFDPKALDASLTLGTYRPRKYSHTCVVPFSTKLFGYLSAEDSKDVAKAAAAYATKPKKASSSPSKKRSKKKTAPVSAARMAVAILNEAKADASEPAAAGKGKGKAKAKASRKRQAEPEGNGIGGIPIAAEAAATALASLTKAAVPESKRTKTVGAFTGKVSVAGTVGTTKVGLVFDFTE